MSTSDRLEFSFQWDRGEHQRFYRTIRWLLNVWLGFIGLVGMRALWPDSDGPDLSGLVPVVIVAGWFVFDRWGLAYLNARSYEREHGLCIPNDQLRVLDADGILAQCTISSGSVRWAGIRKVLETDEFFLFFTSPGCAIHLPKRAVEDIEQVRARLPRRRRTSA